VPRRPRCAALSATVISHTLATFDSNFSSILAQLRTALQGTGDLVTMNYYFPQASVKVRLTCG
jgi:hypothetical protein